MSSSKVIMPKAKNDKQECEKNAKEKNEVLKTTEKVMLLCQNFELFHNQDKCGFAIVKDNDVNKVFKIRSNDLRYYLNASFYKKYKTPISTHIVKEVLEVLESKALFEGSKRQTYIRIANLKNKIYIDLCNESLQCIEIDYAGYRILNNSPVMFERKNGMLSLPLPEPGGSILDLKDFINVGDQFPLVVAWLLGALRGIAPFPILLIRGSQGSGKSTLTEIIRMLVDPSEVLTRGIIKEERDLVVSAKSSYMMAIDNISKMNYEIIDRLCQASTGGGYSRRKLHTDCDEVLLKVQNPIALNGIDFIPDRPDLLERAILIEPPPLTSKWTTKKELMENFEANIPKILGALYNLLVVGLRELANTKLEIYPRMADFAQFVTAAEKGLPWEIGTIVKLLDENQNELAASSVDECIFSIVLIDYLKEYNCFIGTAQDLITILNVFAVKYENKYGQTKFNPDWPKTPQRVGRIIARMSPYFIRLGVNILRCRSSDKDSRRIMHISFNPVSI